jgi:large subunit ribosomal protein L32
MRHTRSHTGNRRSHHALKPEHLARCKKCGEAVLPHRVCLSCGTYKNRQVLDIFGKLSKKEKKKKEKELAAKEQEQSSQKTLDAAELSKKKI